MKPTSLDAATREIGNNIFKLSRMTFKTKMQQNQVVPLTIA